MIPIALTASKSRDATACGDPFLERHSGQRAERWVPLMERGGAGGEGENDQDEPKEGEQWPRRVPPPRLARPPPRFRLRERVRVRL